MLLIETDDISQGNDILQCDKLRNVRLLKLYYFLDFFDLFNNLGFFYKWTKLVNLISAFRLELYNFSLEFVYFVW